MEITTDSVKNFLKNGRNKLIFVYWLLMFLAGVFLVLKFLGRI